jgi:hypothetical protein
LDKLDIADITFGLGIDELRLAKNTAYDIVLEGESTSGGLRVPRVSWTGIEGGQHIRCFDSRQGPAGPHGHDGAAVQKNA